MLAKIVRMAALAAAMIASRNAIAGDVDVLYWMVDDQATITSGGDTVSILDFSGGDSSLAARVRVTGGDITGDTFLDLYIGNGQVWDGEFGVDFEDIGAGYVGAGVPYGNQSPTGDYSAGTPEYAFTVELGNVVYDDTDGWSWTTVATSATKVYSELGSYIHETFDMTPGVQAIWAPTEFTAVPEPTSGMLAILGMALLALRRRRCEAEA